ncbi:hypothetical protein GMDG_02064 [Pseudogymnoascus destructans 20631-21]|uniref:Uncharacterized protein n=1 Tax=Pseudogymnoascus destructans (strain ATCC MYA-4855 / 20631-21) TaxID=658429 RepID=L8FZ30_PSED2|nr:hypothetical protein GMDG_02064 [Pseudogymnoascus destructans 20631-21]
MATVNMSNFNFYTPNAAPKLPLKKLAASELNNHRQQPSALRDDRNNDSSDDSLPLFDELFRPYQNKYIPQILSQNHDSLHRRSTSCNTQREPLIIEYDSDDESDNEAETGVASRNLLASIEDQDASEWPGLVRYCLDPEQPIWPVHSSRLGIRQCRLFLQG